MEELQISTVSGGKINPAAVMVRDAYKQYGGGSFVLKGLNMNVPAGTM